MYSPIICTLSPDTCLQHDRLGKNTLSLFSENIFLFGHAIFTPNESYLQSQTGSERHKIISQAYKQSLYLSVVLFFMSDFNFLSGETERKEKKKYFPPVGFGHWMCVIARERVREKKRERDREIEWAIEKVCIIECVCVCVSQRIGKSLLLGNFMQN